MGRCRNLRSHQKKKNKGTFNFNGFVYSMPDLVFDPKAPRLVYNLLQSEIPSPLPAYKQQKRFPFGRSPSLDRDDDEAKLSDQSPMDSPATRARRRNSVKQPRGSPGSGRPGGEAKATAMAVRKDADAAAAGGRRKLRLVKYDELPEYLKDNEYIRDHYRSEWPIRDALLSVFAWHNETLNIWTHLGGFLLFLALTMWDSIEAFDEIFPGLLNFTLSNSTKAGENASMNILSDYTSIQSLWWKAAFSKNRDVPRWPRLVFLLGSMGCLSISAISHLLACHSHRLNLFFWRLDYAGISLMIVASFFPPIYYAFLCQPLARLVYLSTITTIGFLVILTLLAPVFSSPKFRPFRALLFLVMGFSGVIPALHALWINWEHNAARVSLALELVMAGAYASGALVYVSRVPEKWHPGEFDLVGHSHQIFHVLVLVGALTHYAAVNVLLDWRDQSLSSCNISGLAL